MNSIGGAFRTLFSLNRAIISPHQSSFVPICGHCSRYVASFVVLLAKPDRKKELKRLEAHKHTHAQVGQYYYDVSSPENKMFEGSDTDLAWSAAGKEKTKSYPKNRASLLFSLVYMLYRYMFAFPSR